MLCALLFVFVSAGSSRPARIAMMAITTRSSIKVNAACLFISLCTNVGDYRSGPALANAQLSPLRSFLNYCGEPQAARADSQSRKTQPRHQRLINRHAGQNHVGAVRRQADDFFPLGKRQTPKALALPLHLFPGQARRLDPVAIEFHQPQFEPSQDAGGPARADELHRASGERPQLGLNDWTDLVLQELALPGAARLPLCAGVRIGVGQLFQQPDRAERETVTKLLTVAFPENEFRAAAADIDDEQRLAGKNRVRDDTAKYPIGLLFAGDDFDRQSRSLLDGGNQFPWIGRVPRRARRDNARRGRSEFTGMSSKLGHRPSRARDGRRLKAPGLVETAAETGLFAPFDERFHAVARHFRHEQLDGIGADVNDGAANATCGR